MTAGLKFVLSNCGGKSNDKWFRLVKYVSIPAVWQKPFLDLQQIEQKFLSNMWPVKSFRIEKRAKRFALMTSSSFLPKSPPNTWKLWIFFKKMIKIFALGFLGSSYSEKLLMIFLVSKLNFRDFKLKIDWEYLIY